METLRDLLNRRQQELALQGGTREASPKVAEPELCKRCKGAGWLRRDLPINDPGFGGAYPCPDCGPTEEEMRMVRWDYSRLPKGMLEWRFETFRLRSEAYRLKEVLDACHAFAEGKSPWRWLVLSGTLGWGKTHLAAAVLNARIDRPDWGPSGRYINYPEFLNELKAGFRDDSYFSRLQECIMAPLLVIDDLGASYHKWADDGMSWAEEQIYLILNRRSVDRMETIITTNVTPDRIDGRISDRIQDSGTGLCRVFDRVIPSYRRARPG